MRTQSGVRPSDVLAALCMLLLIFIAAVAPAAAQTRTFEVVNDCSETVWAAGSGSSAPVFNGTDSGGIELAPGATATTTVPDTWSAGRIWGRRECTFNSSGVGSCATGDCGGLLHCTTSGAGNTTLTEWTLSTGPAGDNYDISIVDAFDFPVSVQLNDPNPGHCVNPACTVDLRQYCTGDQETLDSSGNVVGCKSLSGKYHTPNYGCIGLYGTPASCNNVGWDINWRGTVVRKFCEAYGYPYDDPSSDIACFPAPTSGYIVTFCPNSTVPNADPTVNPTFVITATNDGQTVSPGNSVTYDLNVTASSTFTGTVALTVHDLPASCTYTPGKAGSDGTSSCSVASTGTFSTTSISLTPNDVVPVTLTVTANTSPAPSLQTSGLEVMGKSGATQNVWEGHITVASSTAPDFTLQVNPNTPQTIAAGGSMTYNLTLTPLNGLTGTVNFLSTGTPSGATATFSPASVTFGGTQTATLTVTTPSTATAQSYYPLISAYTANQLHDFQGILTLASTACAAPSTPTGLSATATSLGQINHVNLSWTASTAGTGCPITYNVFRSTASGFTPSSSNEVALGVNGGASGTAYLDTQVSAGTTYYYLLEATDSGGTSAASNQASVTTSGSSSCSAAPTAPSGLTATATSSSQINLSWTASTAGTGCSITYNVFRSTTSGFTPSSTNQIASGVSSTTYSDTGLAPSTTYYYLVEGVDAAGSSAPSNQASATTQAATCSAAPTAPTNLTATVVSNQANLTWTASTAPAGCSITYNVYRSTTNGFTPSSSNQIASGVTTTSFSDTGFAGCTYYLVVAVDSVGSSPQSNYASVECSSGTQLIAINSGGPLVSPFVADEDFTGGGTIDHANTIDTSKVTNPAPAAVYQTARDENFSYTIGGFTAGTDYVVRLHFCETFFTTTGSRTFNVSINGTQVLTDFDIIAASGGKNIANIQQFTEMPNSSGQFVIVFTSVVNNALVSGIEVDSTSSSCTAAPTAPSGLTATATSSSQINLSWTASTAAIGCQITYNIYRSTTSGFTPSSSNQISSGVSATSYSDTGLAASTTYYYLVEGVDSAGSSAASNQASATTSASSCTAAPTAPSGLSATDISSSQINLSWTASTAGTGCSITYNVYSSTTSGFTPSTGNQIASGVTTTSYSNTGLTPSTTYYYLVEGADSAGSSGPSNQANATTSASSGSCTSICIDSGSTTAVSPFLADEDFTGGGTIDHANTINTSKVTNPAPAAVYQTGRDGTFTYTIPGFTANSSHTVRLHFCETYFTASGKRTFNVSINGTQVLSAFDIFATAGGQNIANIQQFTENANSSGQYVITFTSVVNLSLVSGIEID